MPVNVKDIKRYRRRVDDLGGPPEEMPEPIVIDGRIVTRGGSVMKPQR